jgi:hypothetical protein
MRQIGKDEIWIRVLKWFIERFGQQAVQSALTLRSPRKRASRRARAATEQAAILRDASCGRSSG